MKKNILLFMLIFSSLCFITAQENDSSFLDVFQEEDEMISAQNDKDAQENEENERKQEKIKEKKKLNLNLLLYGAAAVNIPYNFTVDSKIDLPNKTFPVGASLHLVYAVSYLTLKGNINWDFITFSDKTSMIFGGSISLGLTPIHNEFMFFGLYGTAWFDKIEDYMYTSYGPSATVIFNLPKNFGVFLNCDFIYRTKEKYQGDLANPDKPRFLNSWRICPSIGISYNIIKG